MFYRAVTAILFVSFMSTPANSQDSCPRVSTFEVSVHTQIEPVQELFDGAGAFFDASARAAGKQQYVPVSGVYRAVVGLKANVFDQIEVRKPGEFCALPTAVDVTVFAKDRYFQFIKEATTGTCLYKVTESHQRRHADLDEQIINMFAPRFATQLHADVEGAQVVSTRSAIEARQQLEAAIARSLGSSQDFMENKRKESHSEIDDAEEIAFMHSCKPEGQL